LQTQFRIYIYN